VRSLAAIQQHAVPRPAALRKETLRLAKLQFSLDWAINRSLLAATELVHMVSDTGLGRVEFAAQGT
jgi:hypothetical protein